MVMLAFSAVTQFPTNGSSTRTAGEGVQASTSAEHVMTVEKRNRIAAAGYHSHVVARLARRYSHQDPMRPHLRSAPELRRMRAVFVSPRVLRRAHPLIW